MAHQYGVVPVAHPPSRSILRCLGSCIRLCPLCTVALHRASSGIGSAAFYLLGRTHLCVASGVESVMHRRFVAAQQMAQNRAAQEQAVAQYRAQKQAQIAQMAHLHQVAAQNVAAQQVASFEL